MEEQEQAIQQTTQEQDAQKCLAKEDQDIVFACLKKVVSHYKDSDGCNPRLVLLTQDGCVPCEEATSEYAADIEAGVIEEINYSSPEGTEIVEKNEIEAAPVLILLDCNGKIIMPV